jgi:tRNA 5-methylaminomethyl-2-thiouridine biosynthesis bifunctional protein
LPSEVMTFLTREEIEALLTRPVALGGWHFPGGGWVSPATLCRALLAQDTIRTRYGEEVGAIRKTSSGWQALGADGVTLLAEAPQLILANAHAALSFAQTRALRLPLQHVRGQISYLPGLQLASLRQVVCRQAYVTPADAEGISCLGATFDSDDDHPGLRLADHGRNLADLEAMLPGASVGLDPAQLAGRVGFRSMSHDRLPLAGSLPLAADALRSDLALADLPRHDGLHCLLGLGARGLVWAPLMAELLAARIEGEPLPLERELADAVDPGRFLLRRLRRGTGTRG